MDHFLHRVLPFLVLAAAAPAQRLVGASGPEDLLPASTYAMARFGGLASCSKAVAEMPITAIVDSFLKRLPEEIRTEHLERGLDEAGSEVQQRLQDVGLAAADVRAFLRQPMVVAVGRLTIEGMGPSVALVVEKGDASEAITRCIAVLESRLLQMRNVAAVSDADFDGVAVRQLQFEHGPAVFAADLDRFFVLTNSRGYLREIVDVARGGHQGLTASSALGAMQGSLPQPAIGAMFLNTAPLCRMFEEHLPYEAADFGEALGLGRLDAVYSACAPSPHGGTDVLRLALRGSERGLFKALAAKPADLRFADVCSPNTVLFAAASFDLPGFIDAFQRVVQLLPHAVRAPLRENMMREMGRNLRARGFGPEELDALLRAFGTDVGFAVALEKGAVPKPELLLRIGVRDAAIVGAVLQQLEGAVADQLGVAWKTRKVGEHEVRFVNLELPNGEMQVSPCYVLLDSALLCASDVAALVRALGQAEDREGSLAAQEDFRAMASAAGEVSGVVHARLFRAAELGWRSVETIVFPMLDSHREEIGFGSEALPDGEELAKALGTSTSIWRVDDDGITLETHGLLTSAVEIAVFGRLADEVLSRATGKIY